MEAAFTHNDDQVELPKLSRPAGISAKSPLTELPETVLAGQLRRAATLQLRPYPRLTRPVHGVRCTRCPRPPPAAQRTGRPAAHRAPPVGQLCLIGLRRLQASETAVRLPPPRPS